MTVLGNKPLPAVTKRSIAGLKVGVAGTLLIFFRVWAAGAGSSALRLGVYEIVMKQIIRYSVLERERHDLPVT